MSQQSIPLSELQSAPAAKFEKIGDSCEGHISAVEWRNQTDPKTQAVKYFASGDAMKQLVITVDTAAGESLALYAKGGNFPAVTGTGQSMLNAIAKAAKDAGAGSIDTGALLTVTFTGEGKKEPGLNAPKLYTASYKAPQKSVPVGELFTNDPSQSQ
jgi:hypothetical protein